MARITAERLVEHLERSGYVVMCKPPLGQHGAPGIIVQRRMRPTVVAEHGPTTAAPALLDNPLLAALPFENMSGNPEQEYVVDDLIDTVTTALSHIRAPFVIACNSAFADEGSRPRPRGGGSQRPGGTCPGGQRAQRGIAGAHHRAVG